MGGSVVFADMSWSSSPEKFVMGSRKHRGGKAASEFTSDTAERMSQEEQPA